MIVGGGAVTLSVAETVLGVAPGALKVTVHTCVPTVKPAVLTPAATDSGVGPPGGVSVSQAQGPARELAIVSPVAGFVLLMEMVWIGGGESPSR